MRELKILAVVVALTLITYWGVEPFAHSQMNPAVSPVEYKFDKADKDSAKLEIENAKKELESAKKDGIEKAVKAAEATLTEKEAFEKTITEFWASNEEAINLK